MIDMENYLIDELHVMLRITDRLWSLLIHEIIASGYFDIAREIIIEEMHRIDEGKIINPKAAIVELSHNIPSTYDKPKKI
ncbi:hypothetical protein RhiirA1_471670 [Rhizophagus irregularis]|uniref:Uncharacterized protein n=1 Tax=Rhizophagus irregularis TaxID=588596 RepID=A0A2I1F7B9_9GLOM|nr:hypothetical protein RhiirA1_471670 [Rhizophagus irregularis]PKY30277.1 hypothetical protein RhiirB3_447286 [Rhizophagus irregularis]